MVPDRCSINIYWIKKIPLKVLCNYRVCCYLFAKICLTFCDPWTVAQQVPLSMGFPRQEHWSGLPFPSLGDLSKLGIQLSFSTLAGRFFYYRATREALIIDYHLWIYTIHFISFKKKNFFPRENITSYWSTRIERLIFWSVAQIYINSCLGYNSYFLLLASQKNLNITLYN